MTAGDFDNSNGVRIYDTGTIALRKDSSGADLRVVSGDPADQANTTAVINQDGSAEFAGGKVIFESSGYVKSNRQYDGDAFDTDLEILPPTNFSANL